MKEQMPQAENFLRWQKMIAFVYDVFMIYLIFNFLTFFGTSTLKKGRKREGTVANEWCIRCHSPFVG
ncbi:hypothetical protein QTP88_006779 [Uroleucon formosanum]